jgi:hypothetical protein
MHIKRRLNFLLLWTLFLFICTSCSKDEINDGITGEYIGDVYRKDFKYGDESLNDSTVVIEEKLYSGSRILVTKGDNNGDGSRTVSLKVYDGSELIYTGSNLTVKLNNEIYDLRYPQQISSWSKHEYKGGFDRDSLHLDATYIFGRPRVELKFRALKVKAD